MAVFNNRHGLTFLLCEIYKYVETSRSPGSFHGIWLRVIYKYILCKEHLYQNELEQ